MSETVYQASRIKRIRATRSEVDERRLGLWRIVSAMKPMTVRQVFYQATVKNLVEKSEAGYSKVQTDLVQMRRAGTLPYSWLTDNTRWQRKPRTYSSIEHALEETARFYRKSLWDDANAYVEVWLEKDALAGVIDPVTRLYDVPLMVARGYASLSFLAGAADYMAQLDVPIFVYHFGDISVELDAMRPQALRDLVEEVINRHLPQDELAVLQLAEQSERDMLAAFASTFAEGERPHG